MKKVSIICGLVILVLAVVVNLRIALNGYGIGTNATLNYEILAQANASGSGSGSDSGSGSGSSSSGGTWKKTTSDCAITLKGQADASIKVFGITYKFPVTGILTLTFNNIQVDCATGGPSQCIYYTCADFWKGSGV